MVNQKLLLTSLAPSPPSIVNLGEFLQARAPEVASLIPKVQTVPKVPNNLRRRLKSFRPFRTVHKRREILRRKGLRAADLQTHKWHSKRFTMAEKWGKKFPLSVNDKGHKAVYRRFAQEAVISDLTYWNCAVLEAIPTHGNFYRKFLDNPDFRAGKCRVVDLLRDEKSNILSPAFFVMIGNSLHVYTHPSYKLPVETERSEISWFELRGPKAISAVAAVVGSEISDGPVNTLVHRDDKISVFITSQGCDVYVHNSLAKNLFIRLVFAGASAIGYQDRFQLFDEFQVPQFPEDLGCTPTAGQFAKIVLEKGILRAGDAVLDSDSDAVLGYCVRGNFSFRLGKVAGLVRMQENAMSSGIQVALKIAVRGNPGRLEPLEWRMPEDPRFGRVTSS